MESNGRVMAESLQGTVERVTFNNDENGYSVLKVRVPGQRDLVQVVGHFAAVTPGEVLRMEGDWGVHARFGEQFRVVRYETAVPASVEGIRKYLGSGLIKGIGPTMAGRIVKKFGEQTLDVIEAESERLLDVDGIGPTRLEGIRRAWADQKDIRELMVFLRGHGVSATYATRIFKHYGKESLDVVRENPFRLAMDVSGIGFITADRIARNLGFAADSPLRAAAGLLYVLQEAMDEGHVCLPCSRLLDKAQLMLEMSAEALQPALKGLVAERRLVYETLPEAVRSVFGDDAAVTLAGYHLAETQAAQRLLALQAFRHFRRPIPVDEAMVWLEGKLPFRLAPSQAEAVRRALLDKVVVITGGPGTGKTTLIRAILTIARHMGLSVNLAAPTGRAAKRLSEATHHPAATLHRLLEFSPGGGGFQRNEGRPLGADLIIVDETSMLDILLMHYLLKAVPPQAGLVLVGDVDQLPSVGPGNVLRDTITSEKFTVVRLTEIFRQARQSRIVVNAHRVQKGEFPLSQQEGDELQDFYFISKEDPEEAAQVILKLCTERIPARFGLDPIEEIQVLSPMNRGAAGAGRLNTLLQESLNPGRTVIERNGRVFRLHDKVMQVRNNYDKDVFNGDMGRIRKIDFEEGEIVVDVDGRAVPYDFSELDELVLAYAITVHKAQGSEYPAVVFPLLTQHYIMLQRNLVYTAITRAKKLVVVVGSKRALAMALRNDGMQHRFTLLRERLLGLLNGRTPVENL